jgi:hypothetical protein
MPKAGKSPLFRGFEAMLKNRYIAPKSLQNSELEIHYRIRDIPFFTGLLCPG